jgi:adenylyltransferase/sulfurtransferase
MERYKRQIILKDFGEAAQQALMNASVLVIGAGGLGCPVLLYLAGAGIGTIAIADGDVVSLNNLHRQVLFSMEDIGKNKAIAAKEKLLALNPDIKVDAIPLNITVRNAWNLLEQYDYIVDGTDNFAAKYMINDACVLLNKPLIYGAVSQYEGQMAVLNVEDSNGIKINYRDIFPLPPTEGILSCAEAGVLGVVPGIIGMMQATEIIKLITKKTSPSINRLLTYNSWTQETFTLDLLPLAPGEKPIPENKTAFENTQYEFVCNSNNEINWETMETMLYTATVVDVREYGEMPAITAFRNLHIPISEFEKRMNEINGDTIIFVCQSGERSKKAMDIFSSTSDDNKKLYSLKSGLKAVPIDCIQLNENY